MPKTDTAWDESWQEFREVDVGRRLSAAQRERRNKAIAKYILETGATQREIAAIFGLHHSTIHKMFSHILGSPYNKIQEIWRENKARTLFQKKQLP